MFPRCQKRKESEADHSKRGFDQDDGGEVLGNTVGIQMPEEKCRLARVRDAEDINEAVEIRLWEQMVMRKKWDGLEDDAVIFLSSCVRHEAA
jgi:hypothetical protein